MTEICSAVVVWDISPVPVWASEVLWAMAVESARTLAERPLLSSLRVHAAFACVCSWIFPTPHAAISLRARYHRPRRYLHWIASFCSLAVHLAIFVEEHPFV